MPGRKDGAQRTQSGGGYAATRRRPANWLGLEWGYEPDLLRLYLRLLPSDQRLNERQRCRQIWPHPREASPGALRSREVARRSSCCARSRFLETILTGVVIDPLAGGLELGRLERLDLGQRHLADVEVAGLEDGEQLLEGLVEDVDVGLDR